MFEKFTDRARKIVYKARQTASECGYEQTAPFHVLYACYKITDGISNYILENYFMDGMCKLVKEVNAKIAEGNEHTIDVDDSLVVDDIYADAKALAKSYNHSYVGTEHILLAIIWHKDYNGFDKDYGLDEKIIQREFNRLVLGQNEDGISIEPTIKAAKRIMDLVYNRTMDLDDEQKEQELKQWAEIIQQELATNKKQ